MRVLDRRSVFRIFTVLCLAAVLPRGAMGAEDPFPKAASSYVLKLNDVNLWARRPEARRPMASLTKLMTALVFLERGHLDDTVTVSAAASRETGARLGLKRGERMRADFLLTAALVGSANDACRALAEHSGKDEPGFVELMNRRAAELGMKGTHFTNASGHDHERHYSTARDLATLAEAAMRNTAIREKVKLVDAAVFTDQGRSFAVSNKNELIGRYPGAIGVKSGFTSKAGKCLIAAAERDGFRALLVFLNAPNRWWEAEAMLDEAFRRGGKQGGSGP